MLPALHMVVSPILPLSTGYSDALHLFIVSQQG